MQQATAASHNMKFLFHFSPSGPNRGLYYPASTQASRVVVSQHDNQDHTIINGISRGTGILIGQYRFESEPTKQQAIRGRRIGIGAGLLRGHAILLACGDTFGGSSFGSKIGLGRNKLR